MHADEEKIKSVFKEHISRVGQWPPSWSDVEDAIREAYWKGMESGSIQQDSMDSYIGNNEE